MSEENKSNLLPWALPVAFLGLVGYLIYKIVSDLGEGLGDKFGAPAPAKLTGQEGGVPTTVGHLTGSIVSPVMNGTVSRALFGSSYEVKLNVANPRGSQVRVKVELKIIERTPFGDTPSEWTDILNALPGDNLLTVRVPVKASSLLGNSASMEMFVNGMPTGAVAYSIL